MSGFLSRLKQQQSTEAPGNRLSLLYGLALATDTSGAACLHLSLALGRRRHGGGLEEHQPYALQPQHLLQPPGFYSGLDAILLKELMQTDPHWQDRASGLAPTALSPDWWQRLLASGRAHAQLPSGQPGQPMIWGDPVQSTAAWQVDEAGWQRLDWQLPAGLQPVFSNGWLYWRPAQHQLGPLQSDLAPAALHWLQQRPVIAPQDALDVLSRQGPAFQSCGLPCPAVFPLRPLFTSPRLLLSFSGNQTASARLAFSFHYTAESFDWQVTAGEAASSCSFLQDGQVFILHRDRVQEAQLEQALLQQLPPSCQQEWSLQLNDSGHWRALILEQVPAWQAQGWQVEIAPDFAFYYVPVGRYQARLETLPDWLELGLGIEVDGETVDLLPLLQQAAERTSLLELQQRPPEAPFDLQLLDGRRICLPVGRLVRWLRVLVEAFQGDSPRTLRLPWSQRVRLAQLEQAAEDDPLQWEGESALLEDARALLQAAVADSLVLPTGFKAQLRDYQVRGVRWLQHLASHGCGGILADDMGLGKTVQTLAHLAVEQAAGRLTQGALIVMPTSLLANWQREAAQFFPALRCTLLHGPRRQRRFPRAGKGGLFLTTYGSLVNDLEQWRQHPLDLLILDEAQTIKNPSTQASRAVRQLTARQRLCLSGTPMENHLGELWSLVDFVMPGYLGNESQFQRLYRTPVEKDNDRTRLPALLERIGPLLLRRRKDEVATELPPKTEIVLPVELHAEQRDLYETLRLQALGQLQPLLEQDAGAGRIQILNALTRLRLLCCDPVLVQEPGETPLPSAKRQHCLDMIRELVEEGRALLVFSQFTRMLDLLAADLTQAGIDHLLLTGRSRNRADLVARFQSGAAPVFLISLKAGGTGLNLTRADTVIHYDPWWNSAAEQQASDRAYRIGQDKPVFIYKLLARDTVEERILALQQSKHHLLQAVYQAAEQTEQSLVWDNAALLQLLDATPTG